MLSPAGSINSSNPSPPITTIGLLLSNNTDSINNNNNGIHTDKYNLNQSIINHNINNNNNNNGSIRLEDNIKLPMDPNTNLIRNLQTFTPIPSAIQSPSPLTEHITNQMLQPRNRLGLILPHSNESIESPKSPVQSQINNKNNNNKPGSPFYAEPADALYYIKRRTQQRSIPLPHNQRFSEPPKGPVRLPPTQVLLPGDDIKNNLAGSLDELKRKHRKARGRLDPWPLDSSWEFLGNDDEQQSHQQHQNQHHHQLQQPDQNQIQNENENDYDSDIQWRNQNPKQKPRLGDNVSQVSATVAATNIINIKNLETLLAKPITIHQIIAKRFPELNVSEIVKMPTNFPTESTEMNNVSSFGTHKKNNRLSAYDNVDKYVSGKIMIFRQF